MSADEAMLVAGILPIFIFWGFFGILFAIGNYFLAMRLGTNKFLWVFRVCFIEGNFELSLNISFP